MSFKFLIDECLTPRLRQMAAAAGHHESTSVRDRGWQGTLDHDLMRKVIEEDFTLVTNNSVDFRGAGPGNLSGHHSNAALHAGLVCLNGASLDLDSQRALFAAALDIITHHKLDLVNQALELFLFENGSLEYSIYEIPLPANATIASVTTGTWDFQPYLDPVADGTL
jgi:hypothetical protein